MYYNIINSEKNVDWIHMGKNQWQTFMNMAVNLWYQ